MEKIFDVVNIHNYIDIIYSPTVMNYQYTYIKICYTCVYILFWIFIYIYIHICTEVLNVVPPVRPYLDIPSSIPRFESYHHPQATVKTIQGSGWRECLEAKRLTTSWLGFQFIQSTTRYPADFKIFAWEGSPAAPVTTTCREYTTTTAITTTTRRYQKLPLLRKQKNQKNKGRSNQDDMSHQNNFYSIGFHPSPACGSAQETA